MDVDWDKISEIDALSDNSSTWDDDEEEFEFDMSEDIDLDIHYEYELLCDDNVDVDVMFDIQKLKKN